MFDYYTILYIWHAGTVSFYYLLLPEGCRQPAVCYRTRGGEIVQITNAHSVEEFNSILKAAAMVVHKTLDFRQ